MSNEAIKGLALNFVDEVKARLHDQWDNIDPQTKQDIQDTATFAAEVALELAAGREVSQVTLNHLNAQIQNIKVLGVLEIRSAIDDILDIALRVGKTFLKFAVETGIKAAVSELK